MTTPSRHSSPHHSGPVSRTGPGRRTDSRLRGNDNGGTVSSFKSPFGIGDVQDDVDEGKQMVLAVLDLTGRQIDLG